MPSPPTKMPTYCPGWWPVTTLFEITASWISPPLIGSSQIEAAPPVRTPNQLASIVHGPPAPIWMKSLWLPSPCGSA